MSSQNYEEKYTKPDLRRQLKEDIKQSDKGGEPGQWSARKSQLLVQAYEKHGGDYKKDKKDDTAKSLEEWTQQNWQTVEGDERARKNNITQRYLPEAVWNRLSEEEKKEAERTKEKGSKQDEQYVGWTPAIKRAMAEAGYAPDLSEEEGVSKEELYEKAKNLEISGRSKMNKPELQEAVSSAIEDDGDNSPEDDLNSMTKEELYKKAKDLEVSGRSQMNKSDLREAVRQAQD